MRLDELKGHRVGICVSGGLDSKTVATRLLEAGVDIHGFTADLAQPDETDVNDIIARMAGSIANLEAGQITRMEGGPPGATVQQIGETTGGVAP